MPPLTVERIAEADIDSLWTTLVAFETLRIRAEAEAQRLLADAANPAADDRLSSALNRLLSAHAELTHGSITLIDLLLDRI